MILIDGNEVVFENFPNGETRLIHTSFSRFAGYGHHIYDVHFKYENDSDLIKLMFLKNYLDRYDLLANLTVYYMPYSRMDRSEDNSPFTLKYVANFINSLKFYEITVIEPHSDVTCALLNDANAHYINFDLIEKVKKEVGFDEEKDYIVFPDAGASKRYSKMKVKNALVGHKNRDFETGEIKGLDLVGSLTGGKKAIIVDDLSSYGNTFIRTSEELRKQDIDKIYLLVAHAENSIFKGELFDHVDKVFTTNSILTEQNNWGNKKFENQLKVYNLKELLG